eukprot:10732607-Alexandrium_andersonii.AAC.1
MEFASALRKAWSDPTTKERHFTTPLAMATVAKRAAPADDSWRRAPPVKKGKGDSKGDKKGDGKGRK